MVPVATVWAPRPTVTLPAVLVGVCRVTLKLSLLSKAMSPATFTVRMVEVLPAVMVPLRVIGSDGAPAKSAEAAWAEVTRAENATSPVVPPVRSTVKVKAVVPALPSARLTVSEPAAMATLCVSPEEVVKALVENGTSGFTVSIDWSPLASWNTQLPAVFSTVA